jgi:peptide chain release factor 1
MLEKLEAIRKRYIAVEESLSDPASLADMKLFAKLNKEYKELKEIDETGERYKRTLHNLQAAKDLLSTEKDLDLLSLAREELLLEEKNKDSLEEIIKYLLIPRDPEDAKNIVLEIRAGTGGDEASIFAGDLFRMYCRFFDKKGWKY